jgi:hypothetical protein
MPLVFRLISPFLVACLATLPLVPVAHVHETHGQGGHGFVVHSHDGRHHHAHPDDDDADDHHATTAGHDAEHATESGRTVTTVDHDSTVVARLDLVLASPQQLQSIEPATTDVVLLEIDDTAHARRAPAPVVERLIHGPPRAPAELRGPPTPSHL